MAAIVKIKIHPAIGIARLGDHPSATFESNLAASYQPHTGGPTGHNIDDPMFPWDTSEVVTPRDVLDHHALGFCYDNEPAPTPEMAMAAEVGSESAGSSTYRD